MYLFKTSEPGGSKHSITLPKSSPVSVIDISLFLENLTAEEKPVRILLELCLLVLLLHAWIILRLQSPSEQIIPAQPLIMQVSLITAPAAKPPTATQPKSVQPIVLKKPKQMPLVPKKAPAIRKPDAAHPPKPAAEAMPSKTPSASAPTQTTMPSPATTASQTSTAKTETFTEANYRANYAFNPKPNYPRIARSRGWQGKVLLRVQVSAAGTSVQVSVHQSSGHDILDESAVEAVRKWRFIPARRGDTAVASSVVVPILFTLQN